MRQISRAYETGIPTYLVGPLSIKGKYAIGDFQIPLATQEKPLVPSVNRGCKVARECGGVETIILKDEMTRAPLLKINNLRTTSEVLDYIGKNYEELADIANSTTRYGKLTSLEPRVIGDNLYLRVGMFCGDAAGHNIVTKAATKLALELEKRFTGLSLVSPSGNYCVDKKPNAIDFINGRGKSVIAHLKISREICQGILRTHPEKIYDLNIRKNLIGSVASVSIGANAHYANILQALYLATGQDDRNIIEGSQGITTVSVEGDALSFFVTLPSLIIGTVGGGTKLDRQRKTLDELGCAGSGDPIGSNSKKLAEITAATVLVGELNLLAVLTNKDELIRTHENIERSRNYTH